MRKEFIGFLDSARRRGFVASLKLLASEILFDFRSDTRTRAVEESYQLGNLAGSVDPSGLIYHAVNPMVFTACIDALKTEAGRKAIGGTFVDFGCGKGRALVLAARLGFDRVVGVECSSAMYALCRTNLRAAWIKLRLSSRYEVILGDAATFHVPDDSTVWFWFNPFPAATANCVADRLIESLQREPRVASLIYARPAQLQTLLEKGFVVTQRVSISPRHCDAVILQHIPVGT